MLPFLQQVLLVVVSDLRVARRVVRRTDDHVEPVRNSVRRDWDEHFLDIAVVLRPVAGVEVRRVLRRLEIVVLRPPSVVRKPHHVYEAPLRTVRQRLCRLVVVLEHARNEVVVAAPSPFVVVEIRVDGLHHSAHAHAVPPVVDEMHHSAHAHAVPPVVDEMSPLDVDWRQRSGKRRAVRALHGGDCRCNHEPGLRFHLRRSLA